MHERCAPTDDDAVAALRSSPPGWCTADPSGSGREGLEDGLVGRLLFGGGGL